MSRERAPISFEALASQTDRINPEDVTFELEDSSQLIAQLTARVFAADSNFREALADSQSASVVREILGATRDRAVFDIGMNLSTSLSDLLTLLQQVHSSLQRVQTLHNNKADIERSQRRLEFANSLTHLLDLSASLKRACDLSYLKEIHALSAEITRLTNTFPESFVRGFEPLAAHLKAVSELLGKFSNPKAICAAKLADLDKKLTIGNIGEHEPLLANLIDDMSPEMVSGRKNAVLRFTIARLRANRPDNAGWFSLPRPDPKQPKLSLEGFQRASEYWLAVGPATFPTELFSDEVMENPQEVLWRFDVLFQVRGKDIDAAVGPLASSFLTLFCRDLFHVRPLAFRFSETPMFETAHKADPARTRRLSLRAAADPAVVRPLCAEVFRVFVAWQGRSIDRFQTQGDEVWPYLLLHLQATIYEKGAPGLNGFSDSFLDWARRSKIPNEFCGDLIREWQEFATGTFGDDAVFAVAAKLLAQLSDQ
jgi:hypothetical protein